MLKLGDPVVLADDAESNVEWERSLVFKGTHGSNPSISADLGHWGILQQPLGADEIGLAGVSGITLAELNSLPYAGHPYAEIYDHSPNLSPNWYGSSEILNTETYGLNSYIAVIRMGPFVSPTYKAKSEASIAVGGSGAAGLWFAGADTTVNITAYLNWMGGSLLIDLGRLAIPAHLPHILQRRGADFILCCGNFCVS